MADSLESALLVTLREGINWESALAPVDTSGTLTPVNPLPGIDYTKYQRRDRELAFRDLINAAAVVQVSVEVSDVWNASALKPTMQGPQRDALPLNLQDIRNVNSKVVHVTNASVPWDAANTTDRDLAGRDALIYETLARAAQTFTDPPIAQIDSHGTVFTGVSAWSLASGTAATKDIASALPMSRDTFRDPDYNLVDRDNQMAGYTAQLVQVLRNPFEYANRIYVKVSGADARESDIYVLAQNYFTVGVTYNIGDEVYYSGGYYRATAVSSEYPTNTGFWTSIYAPTNRVWAIEPRLTNRNRIIYNTVAKTLQWFRESSETVHVPQIYALSIPGVLSGQRIETVPEVPVREDAQFWRQKAARLVYSAQSGTEVASITNTASFQVKNSLIQLGGASITVPGQGTFAFNTGTLESGPYKVALLARPDSVVEIAGAQNTQGFGGTLGGATYGATGTALSWALGLPAVPWTLALDYTNVSGSTDGFRVKIDLSGAPVMDETVPLYFNDEEGNALENGEIVRSNPVALNPSGTPELLTVNWTSGGGNFHIRSLHIETDDGIGTYRMTGSLGDAISTIDVQGGNHQADVLLFTGSNSLRTAADFILTSYTDSPIPIRFLQAQLLTNGTVVGTPSAIGFEGFRNDCLERAERSVQNSFHASAVAYGTDTPDFTEEGSTWNISATERWMAFIEVSEPRLRELRNIPTNGVVLNRLYQVASGTVSYNGVHPSGDTFYGSTGTDYTVSVTPGTVHQVGAFRRSKPGDIGQPGLVPAGVEYVTAVGTVTANYTGSLAFPQLASMQPWMIEAGFYAAQSDFWSPGSQ